MSDKLRNFDISSESPLYQLFVSLAIILFIGTAVTLVFAFSGMLIFGADLSVFSEASSSMSGKDIVFLRYFLIIQDISMLIIPALIIMKLLHNGPLSGWEDIKLPGWEAIGLVIALAFALLPIVSFTGQINAVMHLPVWLSGVENWMIKKEESTDDLIDTLIFSNTIPGMVLNLVIIAMIPAIAEEFIFRGILQKILIRLFSSDHIAIFVTAIIFSAIHFQFFGFIPRFILGLVFGYLFLWGGTLWLPIVAHFVNNAFPVILTYFQESGRLSTTPDISLLKQAIALPFWIVICMVILLYFRNKKRSNGITSSPPTP